MSKTKNNIATKDNSNKSNSNNNSKVLLGVLMVEMLEKAMSELDNNVNTLFKFFRDNAKDTEAKAKAEAEAEANEKLIQTLLKSKAIDNEKAEKMRKAFETPINDNSWGTIEVNSSKFDSFYSNFDISKDNYEKLLTELGYTILEMKQVRYHGNKLLSQIKRINEDFKATIEDTPKDKSELFIKRSCYQAKQSGKNAGMGKEAQKYLESYFEDKLK